MRARRVKKCLDKKRGRHVAAHSGPIRPISPIAPIIPGARTQNRQFSGGFGRTIVNES